MQRLLSVGTALVLAAALIVGCSDDKKTTAPNDTPAAITGAVTGIVRSAGGTLEGARVSVGSMTTFSNDDGYFALPDMTVGNAVVRIERDGFATSYRAVSVRQDQTTHLPRVVLLSTASTSLSAAAGGSASSPDGTATVELTGGTIVTAAGAAFSGNVSVEVASARPDAGTFFDAFPGRFEGRRTDGTVVPFESFGFASVVLTDTATGQPLRLADGETAGVRLTVGDPSPPASTPLWSFDESTGVWVEEGSASLAGGVFEGEVSHFTFWNWDLPVEEICSVVGTVVTNSGAAIKDARVFVQGLDVAFLDEALTGTSGQFSVRALRSSSASVWAMKGTDVSGVVMVNIGEACPFTLEQPLTLTQAPFSITTSWGLVPDDLDSHLFIPMNWQIAGQSYDYYHLYYSNEGTAAGDPYTFLDTDDTDSYGPEVITGLATYDGRYEYWVQRYADEGSIVDLPTIVSVQTLTKYRAFDARRATGAETEYWHVFDLVVSGTSIEIISVNRFEDTGSGDEWQNWHGGTDTFYPDTGPEGRLARKKK